MAGKRRTPAAAPGGETPGKPKCGATTSRKSFKGTKADGTPIDHVGDGHPCGMPAGLRTDHPGVGRCFLHGGHSPTHQAAASEELARRAVDTYGLPRDIDPARALLEEVARTAGHVDWLGEKIRDIDPEALVWGLASREDIGAAESPGINETEAAQVNVWLHLYRDERKHLVAVCKTAIAAGIAERQVKLAEQHGHLIAEVLRKVLADPELGLTDAQRRAVPQIARRHLAVVA